MHSTKEMQSWFLIFQEFFAWANRLLNKTFHCIYCERFLSRIKPGECFCNAASSLNNRREGKHIQCQPSRSNRFDERPSIFFRIMLFSETLSMNNIMKHSELGHKNQSTYAEDRNSESVLVSAMIRIFQKEKIITEISSNGCWAISYIFPTHNRIRSANYPMMPRNAIFSLTGMCQRQKSGITTKTEELKIHFNAEDLFSSFYRK